MIAPDIAKLHGVTADLRPLQRELLVQALDGAIYQAEGALRFAERGNDDYAHAAVQRAVDLFRSAAGFSNEIQAENKRIADAERGRATA